MIFSALAIVLPAQAVEQFRQLKATEISAKFTGMEMTDEVHWAKVFSKDGTYISYSMGVKRGGKWRVTKDELCIDLSNPNFQDHCYQVWLSGNRVQLRETGIEIFDEGILQKPIPRNL